MLELVDTPELMKAYGCWNQFCKVKNCVGETKACDKCKKARYCCEACQKENWSLHKIHCR